MPSEKLDQINVINNDSTLDGISVKQKASGKGIALKVDSDSTSSPALVVQGSGDLLDLRDAAGASQFSVSNAGNVTFSGTQDITGDVTITGDLDVTGDATPGTITMTGAATSTDLVSVNVTGDTQKRLIVNAGGGLDWGSGSGAVDTNLYRGDVNILQTDDTFRIGTAATLELGATGDVNLYRLAADSMATDDALTVSGAITANSATTGAVDIASAGGGLSIAEGSNARMGTATLVAGAVTVANTSVTANTRIFLTSQDDNGGTPGFLRVTAVTASTSFVITSSSGTDTSIVAWLLIEPS